MAAQPGIAETVHQVGSGTRNLQEKTQQVHPQKDLFHLFLS